MWLMLTQKDVGLLEKTFATKEDLKQNTQSLKSDLFNKLDSILKEIIIMREEGTVMSHRVSNHEDRIAVLETTKAN